jgi:nitrogen-specific signal transduction histidine kinase
LLDGKEAAYHEETELPAADGRHIPVLKTVITIGVEGKAWLIETMSDISEIKRAEAQQVERERLQAIVETAGAVCHEMNQPLMAVTANCELCLMDLREDDPVYGQVQTILEQAKRMAGITRKLTKITNYSVKQYLDGKILDIDSASDKRPEMHGAGVRRGLLGR